MRRFLFGMMVLGILAAAAPVGAQEQPDTPSIAIPETTAPTSDADRKALGREKVDELKRLNDRMMKTVKENKAKPATGEKQETPFRIDDAPAPDKKLGAEEKRRQLLFNDVFNKLPLDMQDEILDEAARVHKDCEGKLTYHNFHDCRCIASTFMEERLARGPDANEYMILKDIGNGCINEPGIAGYTYNKCKSEMVYLSVTARRLRESEVDGYCQCVGRTMARRYAESPDPDFRYIARMNVNAMNECTNRMGHGP